MVLTPPPSPDVDESGREAIPVTLNEYPLVTGGKI